MLFVLEEIGIELAMVLAVAGSIGCFVYLLTLTFVERHELRRLEVARRRRSATVLYLPSSAAIRSAQSLPPARPRS